MPTDSNPETNGGREGDYNNGKNTEEFIKSLNISHFGGYSDWRMPTSEELISIVNFELYHPAINDRFFSNAMSDFYWSSTTSAYNTGIAWGVYFHYGDDYNDIKVISEKEFTKVLIPPLRGQYC